MDEELLTISPFLSSVSGSIKLPGSKSITARALILAALNDTSVRLKNVLFSEDTITMMKALQSLGFQLDIDEANETVIVHGQGGIIPNKEATINVGIAGTAARFLPALLALQKGGSYKLECDVPMKRRPMQPLIEALEKLGAASFTYEGTSGHYPFLMETKGIPGGQTSIDTSQSGQFLSALLMVAPFAEASLKIQITGETVSQPFIQITEKMIIEFGYPYPIAPINKIYKFSSPISYSYRKDSYTIEPDVTAASYFIALVLLVGGKLTFPGLTNKMKQGDVGFLDVIQPLGLEVKQANDYWVIQRKIQPILTGVEHNFNSISDTFLTFAAIAPLLRGSSRIKGIGHTRHQECNRIEAVANELKKIGQEVNATDFSIEIRPKPLVSGVIHTHNDHRIAMSFAILGSYDLNGDGSPWLQIKNPHCCAKTFPKFFDNLQDLRIH